MTRFQRRAGLLAASTVLVAAGSLVSGFSQTVVRPGSEGGGMKGRFVFIFRQGSRRLSNEEQKRRTEEVRAWALEQNKQGRNLEPRVLGEESQRLGEAAGNQGTDGLVVALNFIEAADLGEAVRIAETHPGLRYGVTIEVRPWRDPRAQP
jgi:hypothetical protein